MDKKQSVQTLRGIMRIFHHQQNHSRLIDQQDIVVSYRREHY